MFDSKKNLEQVLCLIVLKVEEFNRLENFIFDNNLDIYKLLVIDYRHFLNLVIINLFF